MKKCPICKHESKKDMLICENCKSLIETSTPTVNISGSRTVGEWSK